jgi:hypothetical protein
MSLYLVFQVGWVATEQVHESPIIHISRILVDKIILFEYKNVAFRSFE